MIGLDLFSTKFFELQLDQVDAFNLLNEIMRKEDEMKIISSTRQSQSVEEYITDYSSSNSHTVKLDNIDKVFQIIKSSFESYNADIDIISYWTAVYIKTGYHSLHIHKGNILDKCNYSGVIYLSDLGQTTFFSVSPTSFEASYVSVSKMGKVIMFPSTVPHAVDPTYDENNKRYIISFNCEIKNK
jgi:hypothetical protein